MTNFVNGGINFEFSQFRRCASQLSGIYAYLYEVMYHVCDFNDHCIVTSSDTSTMIRRSPSTWRQSILLWFEDACDRLLTMYKYMHTCKYDLTILEWCFLCTCCVTFLLSSYISETATSANCLYLLSKSTSVRGYFIITAIKHKKKKERERDIYINDPAEYPSDWTYCEPLTKDKIT